MGLDQAWGEAKAGCGEPDSKSTSFCLDIVEHTVDTEEIGLRLVRVSVMLGWSLSASSRRTISFVGNGSCFVMAALLHL